MNNKIKPLSKSDLKRIEIAMRRANPDVDGDLLDKMRKLDPYLPQRFLNYQKQLTDSLHAKPRVVVSRRSSQEFEAQTGRALDGPAPVSDEQAEQSAAVVCLPKESFSPFSDNLVDRCCMCGREVMVRPHAPKRPPRLCMPCYLDGHLPPPVS